MQLRRLILITLLIAAAFFMPEHADAQCAMCKATAESASENIDKSIGEGLNRGILYLMGIPYLLIIAAVLIFFRKKIAGFYRELAHHH